MTVFNTHHRLTKHVVHSVSYQSPTANTYPARVLACATALRQSLSNEV
ncbi:hypothetical protein [Marinagarivorans cellulosilyticus]|nr:hypothetical protein [Marinagarivorans cellulosilyticus]